MSLSTELTGVQAAQTYIDTLSNNIANVDTTGFKMSNVDFASLYANGTVNTPGEGVTVGSLAQSFTEGVVNQTGNPFDLTINGNGFFELQTSGGIVYSRDGSFQVDQNGNLATAGGALVLGYPPSSTGATGGALQPIQVSTASVPGTATSNLTVGLNLSTTDPQIDTTATPFDPSNSASYDESTSTAVYDSLGTADTLTTYYTAVSGSGSPPQWQTHWVLTDSSGNTISSGAGPTLTFNSSGQLVSGSGTISVSNLPDGAAPLNINLDYSGSTLSNLAFAVNSVTNDGQGSGQFTGATVASNGQVIGQYSNGATQVLGTIALASFANPQGLVAMSGNVWASSSTSGPPISGIAGTGGLGQLQAGAIEGSNVDLTSQLVDLIVAQQAYQANAQGINVEQQDFQKLMTIQ